MFKKIISTIGVRFHAGVCILAVTFLAGCTGLPKNVEPVKNFKLNQYLGTWYEVARLDHSFERGLSHVKAEYVLKEGGGITVKNTGFNQEKNTWSEAEGRAYFKGDQQTGHLKVSFFGPFYASYVIFYLDDYQHAFVSGYNHNNLWLLSRTPTVSQKIKDTFLTTAKQKGFDTSELIWVDQTPLPAHTLTQ